MNNSELPKPQNSLPGFGPVTSCWSEKNVTEQDSPSPSSHAVGLAYKVGARYNDETWHLLIPGMRSVVRVASSLTPHRGFLFFMCYAGRLATQECVVRAFIKANPTLEKKIHATRKSWFCTEGARSLQGPSLEALNFEHNVEGLSVYHAFLDFVADNFWNKRTFTIVMRFYSAYKMSGSPATHDYDILVRDEVEQQQELEQHFRRSLNSDARFEIKVYCLETNKLLLSL